MPQPIQNLTPAGPLAPGGSTKSRTTEKGEFSSVLEKVSGSAAEIEIARSVQMAAQQHGVPASLILAVIKQESNFNPQARSHAGAVGLMQLMPETARTLGVQDPLDVSQNIDGGTRYLRQMIDRFDGDLEKALAAYNCGPERVDRHGGIPPIAETESYVPSVLGFYQGYRGIEEVGRALRLALSQPPPLDLSNDPVRSEDPPPPPQPPMRRV